MNILNGKIQRRQQALIALFSGSPIQKSYGMSFRYDEHGSAIFELPYHPGFDHALGGVHGGVMATLLDNAGWFTVAAHHEFWIATVEFQTRLLEPVVKEDLQSRGWIIRPGKSITVAGMEVKTAAGRLVAVGSGSFTVTSKRFG